MIHNKHRSEIYNMKTWNGWDTWTFPTNPLGVKESNNKKTRQILYPITCDKPVWRLRGCLQHPEKFRMNRSFVRQVKSKSCSQSILTYLSFCPFDGCAYETVFNLQDAIIEMFNWTPPITVYFQKLVAWNTTTSNKYKVL